MLYFVEYEIDVSFYFHIYIYIYILVLSFGPQGLNHGFIPAISHRDTHFKPSHKM